MKRKALALITWFAIIASVTAAAEDMFDDEKFESKPFMDALVDDVLADDLFPKGEQVADLIDKALKRKKLKFKKVASSGSKIEDMYSYARDRTYKLVVPYNCGSCDKWHGRNATAWALSEDGLMMTNYHCFVKDAEKGVAVVNYDMEVFPAIDFLIADKDADFVIFKVKLPEGKTIKAFPLGQPAYRGAELHLVSHLLNESFYYSNGYVSGYKMAVNGGVTGAKSSLWMQTEIGYRYGSSGGGIINEKGEVVGMVSYIISRFDLYKHKGAEKEGAAKDRYAVKIFENTVPVSAMRKRLKISGE